MVLDFVAKAWTTLFSNQFISILDDVDKFTLAEALWRIGLRSSDLMIQMSSTLRESNLTAVFESLWNTSQLKYLRNMLPSNAGLVTILFCFIECASVDLSSKEKSLASILLLVFVRHLGSLDNIDSNQKLVDISVYFTKDFIMCCMQILLRLLSEQNLFIQDISCLVLCHLYNLARTIDNRNESTSKYDIHRLIASDVIATITREKRTIAPAGVSVAGESTSTSSASTVDTPAQISDLLREALNRARQPGTGANQQDGDALLEAANSMIREMPPNQPSSNNNSSESSRYSTIYSSICKIARKSSDPGLLFAMLSLIKRDPNHSCIGTNKLLSDIYEEYRPRAIEFNSKSISSIIPVIFQHKFDPTSSIREVMKVLWDQIVLASYPQALWTFETEILELLTHNLSSAQWRDREAACNALETYLPQRPWQVIRSRIDILWTSALRLIDDMRESTRNAGIKFAKILSELILQRCDKSFQIDGVPAVDIIRDTIDTFMDLIMEKGLFTSSQVSIAFSLGIIIRIVDLAGVLLQNWFPKLISVLIEAMSALEPGNLQYLQFHTSRMQLSVDDLESFRVQLAQQSPMQEALDKCLQHIGDKNLAEVMQSICFHLNRGVGLATRIAAAQSISKITERYPKVLQEQEYTAKAFHLIVETLTMSSHLSPAMKRSFVNAQGALAKISSSDVVVAELSLLLMRYKSLGRDESQVGPVIATTIHEIVKRSGDGISFKHALWPELLSLSFIGSFEADEEAKSTWTSIWNDVLTLSGGGTKILALLRSLSLLLPLILVFLNDNSWKRRVQGLQALSDIILTLPSQQVAPNIGQLVEVLLKMISGHAWTGKHYLYSTISSIMSRCSHRLDYSSNFELDAVLVLVDTLTDQSYTIVKVRDLERNNDNEDLGPDDAGPIEKEMVQFGESRDIEKLYSSWRLLPFPLIQLLINECDRSSCSKVAMDKDYPLYCAKAISTIPWADISNSKPEIFINILPTLCQQADIMYSLNSQKLNNAQSIESVTKKLSTAVAIPMPPNRSSAKLKSASALFGNRYGGTVSADSSHLKVRTAGQKRGLEGPSSSESSLSQSSEIADEDEIKSSRDPAYRLKFIECISSGWILPVNLSGENRDEYNRLASGVLRWIWNHSSKEIWSIRVASLKLLARIVLSEFPGMSNIDEAVQSTITCIEKAVTAEKKYSKVRAAGLEALEVLVSSKLIVGHAYFAGSDNIVKNIARVGLADSEPIVVQIATRIVNYLDKT